MTNGARDKISGLVFIIAGLLVVAGAWRMPRFEAQGAPLYQAPGLTPGLLGLALAICGLILALRPARARPDHTDPDHTRPDQPADRGEGDRKEGDRKEGDRGTLPGHAGDRKRAVAALVLTLAYGAVLFGTVPYVAATFVFVFAFVLTFECLLPPDGAGAGECCPRRPLRIVAIAALLAAATSLGTRLVFETLFLIRLP